MSAGAAFNHCFIDGNDEVGPFSRITCIGPEDAGCNETVVVHADDDDDDWDWLTLGEQVQALATSQGWVLPPGRAYCPKHRPVS